MTGLVTEEDDDGNAASHGKRPTPPAQPMKKPIQTTVQSQDNGPTEASSASVTLKGSGDTGTAPIHSVASSSGERSPMGGKIGEPAVRDAATSHGGQRYANSQVGELTPEGQGQVKSTVRTQQPTNPPAAFIWNVPGKHCSESIRTLDFGYLSWYLKNGKAEDNLEAAVLELDYRRSLNHA